MSQGEIRRRNTKQRSTILSILERCGEPISAMSILDQCKELAPALNKTTIYRTLDRLIDEKKVTAVLLGGGAIHYELTSSDSHHHHHFVCQRCNKAFCLEGCIGNLETILPKGFRLESHEIILRGHCPECRKKR